MADQQCPLCEGVATIVRVPDHDQFIVTCATCVGYTISGPLFQHFVLARQQKSAGVVGQFATLSTLAGKTQAEGGNLNLTLATWEGLAAGAR